MGKIDVKTGQICFGARTSITEQGESKRKGELGVGGVPVSITLSADLLRVRRPVGWLAGWLVGWLVGWLADWLAENEDQATLSLGISPRYFPFPFFFFSILIFVFFPTHDGEADTTVQAKGQSGDKSKSKSKGVLEAGGWTIPSTHPFIGSFFHSFIHSFVRRCGSGSWVKPVYITFGSDGRTDGRMDGKA